MNLLVTGANSDNIDQLLQVIRSRRRHVKVVKYPVDVADPADPTLHQTVLFDALQNISSSRQQLLFLLPW